MKMYLDCLPCVVGQALRAGRVAGIDEEQIRDLINEAGAMLPEIPMNACPPEIGEIIYRRIGEVLGRPDPYREIKERNIRTALSLVPEYKGMVRESSDPLLMAVKLAAAGNMIDFGVNRPFDIERDIRRVVDQDFAVFDYGAFVRELEMADRVLYIGDNSGEAVFDRILIEEMEKPVDFVVRECPVINDVTLREAQMAGIDGLARVFSSGNRSPGLILSQSTPAFRTRFSNAPLIISKGQGNYEGLSEERGNLFFILKAKCPVIATDLGVREGDIILKSARSG